MKIITFTTCCRQKMSVCTLDETAVCIVSLTCHLSAVSPPRSPVRRTYSCPHPSASSAQSAAGRVTHLPPLRRVPAPVPRTQDVQLPTPVSEQRAVSRREGHSPATSQACPRPGPPYAGRTAAHTRQRAARSQPPGGSLTCHLSAVSPPRSPVRRTYSCPHPSASSAQSAAGRVTHLPPLRRVPAAVPRTQDVQLPTPVSE